MPSASKPDPASQSGIAETNSGERHIPSSTRPDGSVRREIRVRPGYRPPEDVEVYKNRTAEAWKNRGKGGVPGAEHLVNEKTKARRPAKKEKPPVTSESQPATETETEKATTDAKNTSVRTKEEPIDLEAEQEKEAKKISKKLRQARELQQKKISGDALLPEQFEKVIRINELIRQLDSLGFDPEGQKKP